MSCTPSPVKKKGTFFHTHPANLSGKKKKRRFSACTSGGSYTSIPRPSALNAGRECAIVLAGSSPNPPQSRTHRK